MGVMGALTGSHCYLLGVPAQRRGLGDDRHPAGGEKEWLFENIYNGCDPSLPTDAFDAKLCYSAPM